MRVLTPKGFDDLGGPFNMKGLIAKNPICGCSMVVRVYEMIQEAINVEMSFCHDALSFGVTGMSPIMMKEYLEYCADQRLVQLGFKRKYLTQNPFPFMVLQDVQPLTNFFEKRVTEYQKGFEATEKSIVFNEAF